jgi:hypothetical protein
MSNELLVQRGSERYLVEVLDQVVQMPQRGVVTIEDFWFDDRTWVVTKLVVSPARGIFDRRQFITPPPKRVKWTVQDGSLDVPSSDADPAQPQRAWTNEHEGDGIQRRAREMLNVGVYAADADGELGYVKHLIVDERQWVVQSLVVAIRSPFGLAGACISPRQVAGISRCDKVLELSITKRMLRASTEFD